MRNNWIRILTWLWLACVLATGSQARVDRVEIISRTDVLGGKPFGLAGAYEKIIGRVYYKVRPDNPHNLQIVDLDKADRNAAGEVEFSADVYILRPKNAGNGALLLEIPNRGGKGILAMMNGGKAGLDPASEEDFGDGFLMEHGYTVAWLGWQFDVRDDPGLLRLYAPVAHGPNGTHIRGLVRTDFTLTAKRDEMPLGHWMQGRIGGKGYPVADPASPQNVLTVRDTPLAPRRVIPRSQWQFARMVDGKLVPDTGWFRLEGGFEPGKIYELVYVAQDPVVVGLGLAAVRDLVSYLKNDAKAVAPVRRAYAVGISQSGRFLRHFLCEDFNADEQGRQALDGMTPHVAGAGRGSFNHRFAGPSRDAQPMNALFYPTDLFPFADTDAEDPASGETGGLLDKATRSHTVPKMFSTNTSYEYWGRAAALIHISPDGKRDLDPSSNVREYLYAGLQHYSAAFPPQRSEAQQLDNPNPVRWLWRAMLTNLDAWVAKGKEPPASTVPRMSNGTLVSREKLAFPEIPGINVPREAQTSYHLDFGPEFKTKGIISKEPPVVGAAFSIFVPQTDKDGNDTGGITLPELAVPVATYTGWNLRSPSIGAPEQRSSFIGSYIPFAKTEAERKASRDPRPSIEERYQSKDQYLGKYATVAIRLVHDRFLLPEDLPAVLQRGAAEWDAAIK